MQMWPKKTYATEATMARRIRNRRSGRGQRNRSHAGGELSPSVCRPGGVSDTAVTPALMDSKMVKTNCTPTHPRNKLPGPLHRQPPRLALLQMTGTCRSWAGTSTVPCIWLVPVRVLPRTRSRSRGGIGCEYDQGSRPVRSSSARGRRLSRKATCVRTGEP